MALPQWNTAFGCLIRDATTLRSLLRTQLSASLPAPFVSRSADQSAPVELMFMLEMNEAEFRSWQQWFTYDLNEGSLPFAMWMPWGTQQVQVTCRLTADWVARHLDQMRWQVSGVMEIERASLPRFSGGAQ